ncbi:MAG: tetratricopeptide repeat protein [Planctomycetes bacterium]|nr:tetratricopeptide repeat protein [Planctomycetota bacterium]
MLWTRICRWPLAACFWLAASWALAGPAEDQYAVAAGHYAAGRWKLAVEEFDAFLTRFPSHEMADAVRFFSGEALVQQGRYPEARQRFAEFLQRQPDHKHATQARFRSGEAAYLAGDAEAARRGLEEFRRLEPGHSLNGFVLPYLGDLALARGDAAAAQSYYSETLEKHPDSPLREGCRWGLARAAEAIGDKAGAERFYRYLAYQTKGDLADDAQLRLGLLHHHARDYQQAMRELRRLATDFPQSDQRPHALYWLAKSQLATKHWEEAAATLESTRIEPTHDLAPAAGFATGEALARVGRTEEAHRRFADVAATWPKSEWADDALQARIDLALAARDAATVDALAADFQSRFPSSPLRDAVTLAHGRSLLHGKKYGEAATVFNQLLHDASASGGDASVRPELIRYYLGLAHVGVGRNDEAIAALGPIDVERVSSELADGVRVVRAAALVGLERFDEAVPLLEQYLKSQPAGADAPKSRAQLVVALTKLERFADAAAAHDEFAKRSPEHPHFLPATEFLAEAAYAAGDKNLARRMFTILADEKNPPQFSAKGLSGLAWLEFDGNPAESAAAFERIVRDHPDSKLAGEAAMMQARSLERLGQFEQATAMYRLVLEEHAASDSAPAAKLALARLLDRQGNNAEAATLYARYVDEHPQAPDVDAALYQSAWALIDLSQEGAADAAFARIVAEHPSSRYWADAAYRLAERAAAAKDYPRAGQLLQQILEGGAAGEVRAHALYLEGQIAAVEERWSDVAPPMKQLLAEFPDSSLKLAAMYWSAESYYRQRDYEEAGRRLAELAPLAEGADEEWLAMVPLRQAQVLAHQRQWREAFDIADGVAARFPEFRQQYEVDYLLGRCLMAQAKFTDARTAFDRVIRSTTGGRTETAAMAQWMVGETYFHQKNYLEAIKAYHRVERLFPYPRWQAGALLQAGKCREMRNELRDAVQLYAHVLKDFPDTPFTEEAAQRLRAAQQRLSRAAAP